MSTCSSSADSATMIEIQSQRPRNRGYRHASSAATPTMPLAAIATYAHVAWKS